MCYECRTSYQAQAPAAMRRPHTTTPKHFDNFAEYCASPLKRQGKAQGGRGGTTPRQCRVVSAPVLALTQRLCLSVSLRFIINFQRPRGGRPEDVHET